MNLITAITGTELPSLDTQVQQINNVYTGHRVTATAPSSIKVVGAIDYAYVADDTLWVTIRISPSSVRRAEARKVELDG